MSDRENNFFAYSSIVPEKAQAPLQVMLLLIGGFWISRAIFAAASLGLADLLKDSSMSLKELAEATATHAPSLKRLLTTLASIGVFEEESPGRFRNTPLSETLGSDSPDSVRALAVGQLGTEHYRAWGEFLYSLRTGLPGFEKAFGLPVWDYYRRHPENASTFQEVMVTLTAMVDTALLRVIDFSHSSLVVELGGGQGNLISSVLREFPHLQGILLDLPHEVETARRRMGEAGIADRCQVLGGDFLQSVPPGGDSYLLKWVLHDWDDEACAKILGNCFAAMRSRGRLWIIESPIPEDSSPAVARLLDLNMMVVTGGRERTLTEYRQLAEKAGFRFRGATDTGTLVSVIEAVKPAG